MNPVEHQATVDRGLKMKIKRKNVGVSKSDAAKHEIIKGDNKGTLGGGALVTTSSNVLVTIASASTTTTTTGSSVTMMGSPSTLDKLKQTLVDKERDRMSSSGKSPAGVSSSSSSSSSSSLAGSHPAPGGFRNMNKRKNKLASDNTPTTGHSNGSYLLPSGCNANSSGSQTASAASGSLASGSNGSLLAAGSVMVELHRMNEIKKEATLDDPYEFNAKVEDRIGLPIKKVKLEKMENPTSPGAAHSNDMETEQRDISTETCSIGVATDPDCLGPCEPGTSVVLEGIVWNETENGILVVNITWRGKTYVGTLMDATKHAWAPPRFSCESPASGPEVRTPRGRGKRGRNAVTPPVIDLGERRLRKRRNNNNPYAAPPSPARSETNPVKRRGRPVDLDLDLDSIRSTKRARTAKSATTTNSTTPENGFIECPEPNCNKKYRHINGLRYHQAHAHKNDYVDEECMDAEVKEEEKTPAEEKDIRASPSTGTKSGRGRKSLASTSSQGDSQQDTQPSNDSSDNGSQDVKTEAPSPDSSKPVKKSKKEEKAAVLDGKKQLEMQQEKQLEKQPTVSLTPVSLECTKIVSAPSTTSVFQTSTMAPLSCITTVSVVPSTAGLQSTATSTVSALPVAVTTVVSSTEKTKKSKIDKVDNKKSKHMANRPIVVAPTPLASSSSLPPVTTPAQISIAASHPQVANGLKPIQPKPTVLGEPNMINPALAGLKDKKSKKKKNKDKDKDRESQKDKHKDTKDIKSEPHVILAKPQEPLPASSMAGGSSSSVGGVNKSLEALVKMSTPPELQKASLQLGGSTLDKPSGSPPELQKQLPLAKLNSPMKSVEGSSTRPPSSLSLNSPMQNSDGKAASSANAQSPAYSDISDANDSNSNIDSESANRNECKSKEDHVPPPQPAAETSKPQGPAQAGQSGYHGMYGSYYSQGAYHSPTSSNSPQGIPRDTSKTGVHLTPSKDCQEKSANLIVEAKPDKDLKSEEKVKERIEVDSGSKPSPTPAQMREYQERMLHAQQMAQYQYMGYGYGVDMRLLATNPEYKAQYEKWFMEQNRARREYMEHQKIAMSKAGEGKGMPQDVTRPLDLNTKAMDLSKQGKASPSGKPNIQGMNELRHSPVTKHGERESHKGKDVPMQQHGFNDQHRQKEKRMESHFEQDNNVDVKSHEGARSAGFSEGARGAGFSEGTRGGAGFSEGTRGGAGFSEGARGGAGFSEGARGAGFSGNSGYDRQEEYRRYYMYQQKQRMMEHKRHMEHQQTKGEGVDKAKPHLTHMDIKREPGKSPMGKDCGVRPSDMQNPYSNKGQQQQQQQQQSRDSVHEPRTSEHGPKPDKDKVKTGNVGPSGSSLPSSPAGSKSKDNSGYGQYYQQGYPYPGHNMPYDSSHQMYPQGTNTVGYGPQNSYPPYPPHMRSSFPEGTFKESRKSDTPSPSGKSGSGVVALAPQEGKALELLQQKAATYYNSHAPQKVQDLKEAKCEKLPPSSSPARDGERAELAGAATAVVTGKDKDAKDNKDRKSPPTQRHVHTHHHTHLVGPAYSLYGPYGAIVASQQASVSYGSPK